MRTTTTKHSLQSHPKLKLDLGRVGGRPVKGADLSPTEGRRPFDDEDDSANLDDDRGSGDGRTGCHGDSPEEGEEPNSKAKYGQDKKCCFKNGGQKKLEGKIRKDESYKTKSWKIEKECARKLKKTRAIKILNFAKLFLKVRPRKSRKMSA